MPELKSLAPLVVIGVVCCFVGASTIMLGVAYVIYSGTLALLP